MVLVGSRCWSGGRGRKCLERNVGCIECRRPPNGKRPVESISRRSICRLLIIGIISGGISVLDTLLHEVPPREGG
jgi:hypothetical protein